MSQSRDYEFYRYVERDGTVTSSLYTDAFPPPTEHIFESNGEKYFYRLERVHEHEVTYTGKMYNHIKVSDSVLPELTEVCITDRPTRIMPELGTPYEYIYIEGI